MGVRRTQRHERVQPSGTVTVRREKAEPDTKKLKVGPEVEFTEPHCTVGMKAGATIPTTQYANIRIEVSLYMPCLPGDLDETFEAVREWVNARMQESIDQQIGNG